MSQQSDASAGQPKRRRSLKTLQPLAGNQRLLTRPNQSECRPSTVDESPLKPALKSRAKLSSASEMATNWMTASTAANDADYLRMVLEQTRQALAMALAENERLAGDRQRLADQNEMLSAECQHWKALGVKYVEVMRLIDEECQQRDGE